MKIVIKTKITSQDITHIVVTARAKGSYKDAARTLNFSIASPIRESETKSPDIPLGVAVTLEEAGKAFFDGYIFGRAKNTAQPIIEFTCFDRGIYLKRNFVYKRYMGVTPESIVTELCGEFGIAVGGVVATGVRISRNFMGSSIYDVMQTAFTLAARVTGEKYHIGFKGAQLFVVKTPDKNSALIIKGGSNLIEAGIDERTYDMVNAVGIYSQLDTLVRVMQNKDCVSLYGRMQQTLKQSDGESCFAQAQRIIDDCGVEQTISIDNLGNTSCVSPKSVIVKDPYTGLDGLFFIENDLHEWKRGQYFNKLSLSFKQLMNEKEAGNIPK